MAVFNAEIHVQVVTLHVTVALQITIINILNHFDCVSIKLKVPHICFSPH